MASNCCCLLITRMKGYSPSTTPCFMRCRPVQPTNIAPSAAEPGAAPVLPEKAPAKPAAAAAVAAPSRSVLRAAADGPLPGAVPAAVVLQQQLQQQQQQQQTAAAAAAPKQTRPREDAQTVYVQGTRYTKLECVGRGGSSKVFKVKEKAYSSTFLLFFLLPSWCFCPRNSPQLGTRMLVKHTPFFSISRQIGFTAMGRERRSDD